MQSIEPLDCATPEKLELFQERVGFSLRLKLNLVNEMLVVILGKSHQGAVLRADSRTTPIVNFALLLQRSLSKVIQIVLSVFQKRFKPFFAQSILLEIFGDA